MSTFETAVRAPDVSSYLASKGWHRDGDWRGASVWRLGSEARLLIPDVREYEDADELIQAAIAKIAKYEARPEHDVLLDIAEPMVDAQFYRIHPDAPSGSVPLPTGVKAAESVLNLMKTAATAVEQGLHLLYEGRRSQQVDRFLHRVLLGSATPGSYVLTARVPVEQFGPQQLDFLEGTHEFSGRAVVSQLHSALDAARAAAERVLSGQYRMDTFYDSMQQGVSANLCRALGELGGEKKDRRFEIGFTWARGLQWEGSPGEVKFTDAMPRVLAQAGEELTALARAGTAQITGLVTDLHDQQREPSRVKVLGELRMQGAATLSRRSVWVVLSPAEYDEAFRAQRREQPVQASGQLSTSGRRLELIAANFRVLG